MSNRVQSLNFSVYENSVCHVFVHFPGYLTFRIGLLCSLSFQTEQWISAIKKMKKICKKTLSKKNTFQKIRFPKHTFEKYAFKKCSLKKKSNICQTKHEIINLHTWLNLPKFTYLLELTLIFIFDRFQNVCERAL